jgi:FtsH-binding integral membrane protein
MMSNFQNHVQQASAQAVMEVVWKLMALFTTVTAGWWASCLQANTGLKVLQVVMQLRKLGATNK